MISKVFSNQNYFVIVEFNGSYMNSYSQRHKPTINFIVLEKKLNVKIFFSLLVSPDFIYLLK